MTSKIINFFGNFGVWFVVAILSAIPTLESKVSIPLGVSTSIWGENAMSLWGATLVSFLFSTTCGILLMLFLKFFLKKIEKRKKPKVLLIFIEKTRKILEKPLESISIKKGFKSTLFLILFVALPLPICGLYSGACLCVLSKTSIKKSVLVLSVGNFLDSLFVCLVCFALKPFLNLILTIFFIIAIFLIISWICNLFFDKFLKNNTKIKEKTNKN